MSSTATVLFLLVLGCCSLQLATAGQVPGPAASPNIPISSRDRIYTSDQSSNSVSVIDPASSKLLGVIQLGGKLQETLSALYKGQSLVHGMGVAPDHKTLAVVCVGSNALVFIDTATNKVKHITYVGRSPHEAMWSPDGSQIWISVRGEDYIQVLDGKTYAPLKQLKVPDGPGMTIFSPDGRYAYVCSSFTAETVVLEAKTHKIVGRIKQVSPFCPNIAATPDGTQVWLTLKDTGKTQVFQAQPPFKPIAVIETGPITNHVNFAVTPKGQFAYVTVGGRHAVQVYSTTAQPKLVSTIKLVQGDNPHGIWPSGDGSRMYVGLQLSNALAVIDTLTNKLVNTIDIAGQAPMALMYVPQAVGPGAHAAADASANLVSPEAARAAAKAYHIELVSPGAPKDIKTSVVLNSQGLVDSLEAAVSGLISGQRYVLAVGARPDGSGDLEPVAAFKAGKDGASSVTSIGPYSRLLFGSAQAGGKQQRYLTIALLDDKENVGSAVQVQQL